MKLLLDTHVWVWLVRDPGRLPQPYLSALRDTASTLVVSIASMWELSIKHRLGKFAHEVPFEEVLHRGLRGVEVLNVTLDHVREVYRLPLHHRDPFDRMLVAQARVETLTLLTVDSAIAQYDVAILPAT